MGRKLNILEMGRMNVDEFKRSDKMPLVVVLDDVRSMYNVGSVFRTADAFRVSSICLCGITAQPPHPEIHKTALGAEDTVDWQHYPDTMSAVEALRTQGYYIFSIEQCEGSTMLQHLPDTISRLRSEQHIERFAIIMGNEVKGVKQEIVNASDACLEIPQFGTKHSLNVSTTAGMVIWEFAKLLIV